MVAVLASSCGGASRSEPARAERPHDFDPLPATIAAAFGPQPPRTLAAAPFQRSVVTLIGLGGRVTASTFERFDATLTLHGDEPTRLDADLEVDSLAGNLPRTVAALRSRSSLHADRHPTISFRSFTVEARDDGAFVIRGALTLLGKTHTVSVPVSLGWERDAVTVEARVPIDRTDWVLGVSGKHAEVFDQRAELMVRLVFPLAEGI